MDERQRRIARARLLRREGKTYSEIRAVIGAVDDSTLRIWLRGISRPPATYRSCPKADLRVECRRLRSMGLTYTEIAEATGASPGSISPWVRDIKVLNRERAERRRLSALRAAAKTRSVQAQRRRDLQTATAAASIGELTDRELFLVGVALYWAEGSKSKPYDLRERITFINSDPQVISLFMHWLQLLGIGHERCRFRIHIHETADLRAAEKYWANLLGVSRGVFSPATIKRHIPKTNRLNVGDQYRGCLVVSVLKSAELYRNVAGWWLGSFLQVSRSPRRSPEWSELPPWRSRKPFRVN
jgi:transcriptional regulator with XRE-family HTH domain